MGKFYMAILCLLFTSSAFAFNYTFSDSCKEIGDENEMVSSVRIKSVAVFSMRLSASSKAKAVRVRLINMSGATTNLIYYISAPSPTDNIIVNYMNQAMLNNILLDVCYDKSRWELAAISNHE